MGYEMTKCPACGHKKKGFRVGNRLVAKRGGHRVYIEGSGYVPCPGP